MIFRNSNLKLYSHQRNSNQCKFQMNRSAFMPLESGYLYPMVTMAKNNIYLYCVSKESCPFSYCEYTLKNGDFFCIQYIQKYVVSVKSLYLIIVCVFVQYVNTRNACEIRILACFYPQNMNLGDAYKGFISISLFVSLCISIFPLLCIFIINYFLEYIYVNYNHME